MLAVRYRLEIAANHVPREPHERTFAVDALGGDLERARVDVRADDLDIVAVDEPPVLHQPNRNRIRFLPGRAGYRPDADRFPRSLPADNVAEEIRGHAAQLMLLTIEVGLIHREGVDEMFNLVAGIGPQYGEIRLKRVRFGRSNSLDKTTINVIAPVVVEQHSRPTVKKFAETPNLLRGNTDGMRPVSL